MTGIRAQVREFVLENFYAHVWERTYPDSFVLVGVGFSQESLDRLSKQTEDHAKTPVFERMFRGFRAGAMTRVWDTVNA